jgi:hypothetical protein
VPLDPAFSLKSIQAGLDIPEEMGFDAQAFVDDYWDPADAGVTLPRPETLIELFREDLADYLADNHPGLTLDDVKRTSQIIPEDLELLPHALPYIVRTRDGAFSEIAAAQRYQVLFHLYDGATDLIDYTANLPEIAGRRVTIDYEGATPADQALIEANGGIYATAPSTVDLRPLLRIDGTLVATGAAGVGMGLLHSSDMHFLAPVNAQGLPFNVVPAVFNVITTGASQAIGLAVEGSADALLIDPPADDTEGTLSLQYQTAMDYMARVREGDLELGRLMHAYVTTDVTSAILENVVKVTFNGFGVPQTFDWVGLRVDADRSVLGVWSVEGLAGSAAESESILLVGGAEGSLLESLIFEDSFEQNSISTIKILELAIDAGVTVYTRWNTLPLPANTQPLSVRTALQNAILSGNVVTFPADPMTIGTPGNGQWTGTAWIDQDPSNGAAGYLISGSNNGGATVEVWPPEFIDLQEGDRTVVSVQIEITSPDNDSPDPDAIFTRATEQRLMFEYLVHVTYSDASMATLGPYKKTTRNTTRTFLPDNYTFHVWIARSPWWGILAQAQRKVSIVGVLIRGPDDGTFLGKPPAKLVILPTPSDPHRETLRAVVIPKMAPNGAEMATNFSWSSGSLINIITPNPAQPQNIQVEAAGMQVSSAEDDQNLDVDVTILGGSVVQGMGQLNLAGGQADKKHKMTVIKMFVKEVISELIPGVECNKLPPDPALGGQVPNNIPMLLGTITGNSAQQSVRSDIAGPAAVLMKLKVGVREMNTTAILVAAMAQPLPTKVNTFFTATPGQKLYQSVVWVDDNADGQAQPDEQIDVFQQQVRVITASDFNDGKTVVEAAETGPLIGIADELVKTFLGTVAAPPSASVPAGTTTIGLGAVSHPTGAAWAGAGGPCSATIPKYTFPPTSGVCQDLGESTRVVNFVKAALNTHKAAVQAYFAAPNSPATATFPAALGGGTWPWSGSVTTGNWISDLEIAIALGIGGVNFNGTITSVTVRKSDLRVTSITYGVSFSDLYDFNYNGTPVNIPGVGTLFVCRPAAIMQSRNTGTGAGKIFMTCYNVSRTAAAPGFFGGGFDYTFAP